jgi:hypothetical protein
LKAAVIVHLLLDLGGLLGRDAFTELFALKETLQDKVRAAALGLAWSGLEELFAQGPAAEVINGLHILKQGTSFEPERIEMVRHAPVVSIQIQQATPKRPCPQRVSLSVTQRSHTQP